MHYYVSNSGKIRSVYGKNKGKLIHTYKNNRKQELVSLYNGNGEKRNYLVSRLVYCTFNNLPVAYDKVNKNNLICHKDDNPSNNNLDNLFIGTQKDNMQDCIKKNRFSFLKNESAWNKGLSVGQMGYYKRSNHTRNKNFLQKCLLLLNEYVGHNISQRALATRYGISERQIWERINRARNMERS